MHLRDADGVEPLFSIVTVCRNAAASIGRTVEGVLAQTDCGGAAEHIVIDGVSVDDTERRLASRPLTKVFKWRGNTSGMQRLAT